MDLVTRITDGVKTWAKERKEQKTIGISELLIAVYLYCSFKQNSEYPPGLLALPVGMDAVHRIIFGEGPLDQRASYVWKNGLRKSVEILETCLDLATYADRHNFIDYDCLD